MKKFFVFAALILISATVVFGQSWSSIQPPNTPTPPPPPVGYQFDSYAMSTSGLGFGNASPQNTATAGRLRSAADNYIRPDSFTGVTFDKFYAMASFAFTDKANLGFATKIGTLYLATAYAGSFWANYSTFPYTEQKEPTWGANATDPGSEKTVPFYDFNIVSPFNGGATDNRIGVLIGIPSANMGFQVAYTSTNHEWRSFKNIEAKNGSDVQLKKYEAERGTYTPRIAWSMTKGLTDIGFQPYAIVELGFVRRNARATMAGDDDIMVLYSANHFDPKLTVGTGDFTLYKNDSNFSLTAGFDYALLLKFYSNDYNYQDSNGDYKIKKVKGLRNTTDPAVDYDELTYNGHFLQPQLAGAWRSDSLALRFRLFLPVTLAGGTTTPMTEKTDNSGDLEQSGQKESTFVVGFSPRLQLGAQWKIVPKLTLNAGGQLDLNLVNRAIINSKEYTDDATNVTTPATKRIEERYQNTLNSLRAGVTFTPTDNLSFEASSGIGTNNSINVFSTNLSTNPNTNVTTGDGLLAFTSFLVGLKF